MISAGRGRRRWGTSCLQAPAGIVVLVAAGRALCGQEDVDQSAHGLALARSSSMWSSVSPSRRCCSQCARRKSASSDWSRRSAPRCRTGRWPRWLRLSWAMRGIDLISATTFLAEIGDLSRFPTPRELMGISRPGDVQSHLLGDKVKRGAITKAGNRRARRTLIECSWSYRYPPRVGKKKQEKVAAAPRAVREIAWKAQCRLSALNPALR